MISCFCQIFKDQTGRRRNGHVGINFTGLPKVIIVAPINGENKTPDESCSSNTKYTASGTTNLILGWASPGDDEDEQELPDDYREKDIRHEDNCTVFDFN